MQYVSLLSPPFSGSTLLSILLTSQPRSIGFGDTYFNLSNSPKHLCTCGQTFLECKPRLDISNAIKAGGIRNFDWKRASAMPMPRSWPRSIVGYWPLMASASLPIIRRIRANVRRVMFRRFYLENRLMLEHLDETDRYDYYFDGCKSMNRLEILRTEFPGTKLIHMVRHPGAILYHDQRLGIDNTDSRLLQWSQFHRQAREFRSLLGSENYLAVPYERIVQEPGQFLERIAAFLDMREINDADPHILDTSKVHILGNRMRETAERIVDYSNVWRDHVPSNQQVAAEDTFRDAHWVVDLYADWGANNQEQHERYSRTG